ncbi:unnamed protein product [Citrullus colocynthis]|uniref:Uncharacterized protein n=1 Tax=Citrullus colocynthis TaxID=252529 RepID=A0ABP0YDT2_9ROSI
MKIAGFRKQNTEPMQLRSCQKEYKLPRPHWSLDGLLFMASVELSRGSSLSGSDFLSLNAEERMMMMIVAPTVDV